MSPPFYERHCKLPFEEDLTHEFKGHRDLSEIDYSKLGFRYKLHGGWIPKTQRFRKPLSENICGMLNSGKECTIHLGVTDDGQVEGFMMSIFQQDHFILSLNDLLSRYRPSCPQDRFSVKFIPVIDTDEKFKDIIPDPVDPDTLREWNHLSK